METKFNFNSSICTSKEQSERLLILGLNPETADMALVPLMEWDDCTSQEYFTGIYSERTKEDAERYGLNYTPAWSLYRIKEIADKASSKDLHIFGNAISVLNDFGCRYKIFNTKELYSNIIDCISWLIEKGYFNKKYLCEKPC